MKRNCIDCEQLPRIRYFVIVVVVVVIGIFAIVDVVVVIINQRLPR